jgi:hypothetical protein
MSLHTIHTETLKGDGRQLEYSDMPDTCPICHYSIFPKPVTGAFTEGLFGGRLQIVFRCTKHDCENLFIGTYRQHQISASERSRFYSLDRLEPIRAKEATLSAEIKGVSPAFVEIYNQAIAAEALGLEQITGIGLRKALEFLIKDFLITQKPNEKANIEKVLLGVCINNYVDDARIKACAERATWLGNDETHYIRKFIDRDIEDLKILIKLTVNWIESILLTQHYEQNMTKK